MKEVYSVSSWNEFAHLMKLGGCSVLMLDLGLEFFDLMLAIFLSLEYFCPIACVRLIWEISTFCILLYCEETGRYGIQKKERAHLIPYMLLQLFVFMKIAIASICCILINDGVAQDLFGHSWEVFLMLLHENVYSLMVASCCDVKDPYRQGYLIELGLHACFFGVMCCCFKAARSKEEYRRRRMELLNL